MIKEKVKQTIKKFKLIESGDRIVVGVSGGADSVCLLFILNSLKDEFKFKLYVAHLDHMLREESNQDASFVKKLAKKLQLPVFISKVNLNKVESGSIEEIARIERLKFFNSVAKKVKTKKIALAHNSDDQAETILMRIIRGTGLYGLIGILPRREINGITVIRPLIEISRKEIEAFLAENKVSYRTDKTNSEDIYARNKIRNKLLPLLEKDYNKNIRGVLSNLAQTASNDYDFILEESEKFIGKNLKFIDLIRFRKLHPALQSNVLRLFISRCQGNTRRLTVVHINEILDMIASRPDNSIVNLPKGICLKKTKHKLLVYLV